MNLEGEKVLFLAECASMMGNAYYPIDTGFADGQFYDPNVQRLFAVWVKARNSRLERLNQAEKLLRGVLTGDLFGAEDWETVRSFLDGAPLQKICECGPLRNITEGGHFPACTRCHRRLKQ